MTNTNVEHAIEAMRNQIIRIKFTKKDGSVREMSATTCEFIIPEEAHPKGERVHPEHVVAVYDTEAEGWRSFIKENFVSWCYEETYDIPL